MFQCSFRLKQWGDIHLIRNSEQLREIERREHSLWFFALRYQHPDGCIAVDMMENLHHCEELSQCGCILRRQRRKIGSQRFYFSDEFSHPLERCATGKVQAIVGVNSSPDRVGQLRTVHPEMDPSHTQSVRPHGSR